MSFIKKLFKRNSEPPAPPRVNLWEGITWDEVVELCYDKQLGNHIYPDVKVIYSADNSHRGIIRQRPDELYAVELEKLFQYDEEYLQFGTAELPGYWSPIGSSNSIFNTAEHAEEYIKSIL